LEAKFGDEVKSKRVYKTPGTPRFKIVFPDNDDDIIEPNVQSRYRSGVGMMFYLIKYSQPDLCNIVRETENSRSKPKSMTYQDLMRKSERNNQYRIMSECLNTGTRRNSCIESMTCFIECTL
jgi:hypothetical protein